jgi:hypothetical protein
VTTSGIDLFRNQGRALQAVSRIGGCELLSARDRSSAEAYERGAGVLMSIPIFLEGIFNQIAPMFVLLVFNGLLSQLVSLSERKSQTVMADSAFSEGFVRVDAELPFEHLSRVGAERKLLNLGVNRCLAA